jgi:hypothetical protein
LRAAQTRELAQKASQQTLDGALLVGIVMPFQNALDERIFVRPITGLERDGLASLEKTFDLFQTQRFGLLHGDSPCLQLPCS